MAPVATYPYIISRFGDPLFALFIGTSSAYIRIRREHREKHPNLPSDMVSILSLGKGRVVRWWNDWPIIAKRMRPDRGKKL